MLLRNKKTGEIYTIDNIVNDKGEKVFCLDIVPDGYEAIGVPLIKDEKIRKAIRAWAEANDIQVASFYASSHHWYLRAFNDGEQGIDFWLRWEDDPELIENKRYTIAELCGEEG